MSYSPISNPHPVTSTQLPSALVGGRLPVDGSGVTQPVSLAAAVAVTDNAGSLTVDDGGSSLTVDGTVAISGTVAANATLQALAAATSTPHAVVSLGNSQGKTVVGKPGSLASSAATANQTITGASGTVTAAKTLYITAVQVQARLTTFAATATLFGTASFRIGGTAILTVDLAGTGVDDNSGWIVFPEPIPVAAGTAYDWVCTPAAATAMTWKANIVGYEK